MDTERVLNDEAGAAPELHRPFDADDLFVRGVALMIFIKLVMVSWIGLDPAKWYVWPLSWVAFGMMVPALAEWVGQCRERWDG